MGRIEETVELPATPQQVWDVAAEPRRFGEWLTLHRSWPDGPPERIEAGDRVTAVVAVAELPFTIVWTVDEYLAPSAVRLSGTGLAGVQVALSLKITATGSTSTARITAQFDGQLLAGPIGEAVERTARRELRASATKLRELLT